MTSTSLRSQVQLQAGDHRALEDTFRRALDAGITPAEIEALILRPHGSHDSARCLKFGDERTVRIVRCIPCGIGFGGEIGGSR